MAIINSICLIILTFSFMCLYEGEMYFFSLGVIVFILLRLITLGKKKRNSESNQ